MNQFEKSQLEREGKITIDAEKQDVHRKKKEPAPGREYSSGITLEKSPKKLRDMTPAERKAATRR